MWALELEVEDDVRRSGLWAHVQAYIVAAAVAEIGDGDAGVSLEVGDVGATLEPQTGPGGMVGSFRSGFDVEGEAGGEHHREKEGYRN